MATADPSTNASHDDEQLYLERFWRNNSSVFMRWFLSLPYTGQLTLLRNACPDLPLKYDVGAANPSASQLLTPELNLNALLSENGKTLLRLINARATKKDICARQDLVYLQSLRANKQMPTFSGNTLDNVALAFVDPSDPELKVQSLLPSVDKQFLQQIQQRIARNELIEADVWVTLQMRQQVIQSFLANVVKTFETLFLTQVMVNESDAAANNETQTAALGCRYCGKSESTSVRLSRCACQAAMYCCKDHQVQDWPNHKAICKQVRQQREAEQIIADQHEVQADAA